MFVKLFILFAVFAATLLGFGDLSLAFVMTGFCAILIWLGYREPWE